MNIQMLKRTGFVTLVSLAFVLPYGDVSAATSEDTKGRIIEAGDNDGGKLKPDVNIKDEEVKKVKLRDGREEKIDLEARKKRRSLKIKLIRTVKEK